MNRLAFFTIFLLCFAGLNAQWVSTGGPRKSLRTYHVMALDTIAVAVSECEPLYSADRGSHWDYVQYAGNYPDPEDHFYFQGDPFFSSQYFYWKLSTNAGVVSYDNRQSYPMAVAAATADSSGIYLATYEHGLLVSTNGSNFTPHNTGLPVDMSPGDTTHYRFSFSVAVNSQSVFVGTRHGVFKAAKGSFAFTAANNGLPSLFVRALFCNDSLLLANVDTSLYRSTDAGNSWSMVSTPYQYGYYSQLQQFGDTLFASTPYTGIYYSTDDGQTFTGVNPILQYEDVYGLDRIGTDYFKATNHGLYRGLSQMTPLTYNGCGVGIESMAKTSGCIAAATGDSVYISTDLGVHWDAVPNPNEYRPEPMIVSLDDQVFWGGSASGQPLSLFLTPDCAMTWDTTSFTPSNRLFFLSSDGHQAVANIDFTDYWLISDSGATLTAIQRPTVLECQSDPIMIIVGESIYATSCDNTELLRSKDLGQTWVDVGAGLPNDRVCYMELVGGRLFATYADDVYQAVSGDSVWVQSNFGLPPQAGAFFDLEWDGQQYYICNGKKIWGSMDGFHWLDVSAGLPPLPNQGGLHSGMALMDSTLFLGTFGRGVWKRSISEIDVSTTDPLQAAAIHLYPNPAKDRLHWLSDENFVHASCYNALGQMVELPIDAASVNVSALPRGFYFLLLTDNRGEISRGRFLKE